ncbi:hypothetical protein ACZ90_71295 [Streptomyces albus subsp. albus]|nr:hypothetical protein ACZ90_71295 [Streptomyces albus subsp. albus]
MAILLVAILPFVLEVTFETKETANGELTSYSYLNLTALLGGIIAIGYAAKVFFRARRDAGLTPPVTLLLVLLSLVGVFQAVRGSGVVPMATECSAAHSLDLCRPESG